MSNAESVIQIEVQLRAITYGLRNSEHSILTRTPLQRPRTASDTQLTVFTHSTVPNIKHSFL